MFKKLKEYYQRKNYEKAVDCSYNMTLKRLKWFKEYIDAYLEYKLKDTKI